MSTGICRTTVINTTLHVKDDGGKSLGPLWCRLKPEAGVESAVTWC